MRPTSEFIPVARERFPWMNRREAKRIAVLLRRDAYLQTILDERPEKDWCRAESAALNFVFELLELEDDEDREEESE